MSLEVALNNSLSGLNVQQKSLAISAQNLARSREEGFTRLQESIEYDGCGGAKIGHIFRQIDELLEVELRNQTTDTAYANTLARFLDRAERLLGQPASTSNPNESPSDLVGILENFFLSITTLSTTPDSNVQKACVIERAVELARALSSTAIGLQKLRVQADQEIADSVQTVNQVLQDLHNVNKKIAGRQPFDEVYANLEMQRSKALNQLSDYLPVSLIKKDDGRTFVATAGGQVLLDDVLYQLEHEASPRSNSSNYEAIKIIAAKKSDKLGVHYYSEKNINLTFSSRSDKATTKLNSGQIKALLDVRDREIPLIIEKIDNFTDIFTKEVNELYTTGNSHPGLIEITSQVASSNPICFTGTMKYLLLDANGDTAKHTGGGYIKPLNIDLNQLSNFSDLANEINQYYHINEQRLAIDEIYDIQLAATSYIEDVFTFDFDVDNQGSEVQKIDIDGIELLYVNPGSNAEVLVNDARLSALTDNSWFLSPGERKRSNIANSISLHNLPANAQEFTIKVRMRVADNNYVVDYRVNKNFIEKSKRYPVYETSGGLSEIIKEESAIYASASFVDEEGNLATKNDLSFLRIQTNQPELFLALDAGTSNKEGYNQRNFIHDLNFYNLFSESELPTDSAATVAVNKDLINNPGNLNIGRLSETSPYVFSLGASNNELLIEMSMMLHKQISFPTAGIMPKTNSTFSGYMVETIEYTSFRALQTQANSERETEFKRLLNSDVQSISGVNTEEELQKSILIQNAYNASAHIMSVVQELFKVLMQSI